MLNLVIQNEFKEEEEMLQITFDTIVITQGSIYLYIYKGLDQHYVLLHYCLMVVWG